MKGEGKMKKVETKKGDKIYILGNGNQAPYGIGEIIEVLPAAHVKKIQAAVNRYHNAPTMRLNGKTGIMLSFDWRFDNIKNTEILNGFVEEPEY
jgi:hypothetical protein